MKKLVYIWLIAAVMAAIIPTIGFTQRTHDRTVEALSSISPRPLNAERVFFHNRSGDERDAIAFKDSLIEKGAYHVNAFLPDYVVCELPGDLDIGAPLGFEEE